MEAPLDFLHGDGFWYYYSPTVQCEDLRHDNPR
jgi:hypothetical protein